MIKLFIALFFITNMAISNTSSPREGVHSRNTELGLRFFKSYEGLTTLIEITNGKKYQNRSYAHIKLGGYFKKSSKERWGLFLTRAKGLRHDNDWHIKDSTWQWKDSSNRYENLLDLSYSKRFRPDILTPIFYEMRLDFNYNFFNDQQILILKPALHYFYLKAGKPLWSIKFSAPIYSPLNFSEHTIYKYGAYTSLLWHLNKNVILSLYHKIQDEKWSESEESKKDPLTPAYEAKERLHLTGLNLILSY